MVAVVHLKRASKRAMTFPEPVSRRSAASVPAMMFSGLSS